MSRLSIPYSLPEIEMPYIDFAVLKACRHHSDGICAECGASGRQKEFECDKVRFVEAIGRIYQILRDAERMARSRPGPASDAMVMDVRNKLAEARQRLDFVEGEFAKMLENGLMES